MITLHTPSEETGDFLYGAIGVLFSVEDYTADLTYAETIIIDTFFTSLQWDYENPATINGGDANPEAGDKGDPVVDLVSYGNLMELVDMNNRWVYKGS